MKKFFYFIALMILGTSLCAKAEDFTVTIRVDEDQINEYFYMLDSDDSWSELYFEQAVNEFTYDSDAQEAMYIYTKGSQGLSDLQLDKVSVLFPGTEEEIDMTDILYTDTNDCVYIPFYTVEENDWTPEINLNGAIVTLSLVDEAAARTASATVYVDDASKVIIYIGDFWREATLENEGDEPNVIAFNPETETSWSIQPNWMNGIEELYSMTLNGEAVEGEWGSFVVNVADGDVLNITANYPDVDCNVTISLLGEACKAITGIQTGYDENWEPIIVPVSDNLVAKMGDTLGFLVDPNYKIVSATCNGEDLEYNAYEGFINVKVMSDCEIVIDAAELQTIDITLEINLPEAVNVSYGKFYYNGQGAYDDLEETQTIQVSEGAPYIIVKAVDGYSIDSVTATNADGEEFPFEHDSYYGWYLDVAEAGATKITITAHEFERANIAVVFVESVEPLNCMYVRRSDNTFAMATKGYDDDCPYVITGGYLEMPFNNGENPFYFNYLFNKADEAICELYVNNEKSETAELDNFFRQTVSDNVNIADGDVIKVYTKTVPELCNVKFNLEGVAADEVVAVADLITDVVVDDTFTCLTLTQLDLTVTAENSIVTVNGAALKGEDGSYTITIDADTEIGITVESGVQNVTIDNNADNTYYNLHGVRVNAQALTPGVYVNNGRKVVIR